MWVFQVRWPEDMSVGELELALPLVSRAVAMMRERHPPPLLHSLPPMADKRAGPWGHKSGRTGPVPRLDNRVELTLVVQVSSGPAPSV